MKRKLHVIVFLSLLLTSMSVLTLGVNAQAGEVSTEPDYFAHETWVKILTTEPVVDYPVVFVHGIAGQTEFWEKTMQTMVGREYFEMRYYNDDKIYHNYYGQKPSYWVWSVSYYTLNPIEESLYGDLTLYAQRLQRMVDLIKQMTGKDKVVLVAHSMGGLVARKYMSLNETSWNSVHKILTVGSPNEGVITSIGIVGQLADLKQGSEFVTTLNTHWQSKSFGSGKWGVVGAIDTSLFFNTFRKDPNATDSGGPGFIAISSSIPEEWSAAVSDSFGTPVFNTPRYGFRIAVDGGHMGLLYHAGTFRGIHWAIRQ